MNTKSTNRIRKYFFLIALVGMILSLLLGPSGSFIAHARDTWKGIVSDEVVSNSNLISGDSICWVEGTVQLPIEIVYAIKTALANATYLDFNGAECFAPVDLRDEGEWLLISLVGLINIDDSSQWTVASNSVWSENVIVHKDGVNIYAAIAGTELFTQELSQIQSIIISDESKRILDPLSEGDVLSIAEAYRFPLALGYLVYYGTKDGGVHPGEFTAVIGSGSLAVDLMSDGNTGANHAPNDLFAVTSGTVTRKCSDTSRNSTYILIDNGTSKFLYAHILSSTAPSLGASVAAGAYIGDMRTGTFSDGVCGYASQSADFFHVHLEFPGVAYLTLSDWTLNTSSEIWTRGSEIWPSGQWRQIGSSEISCDATSVPSGYTKCADEGNTCSFSGSLNVYYGANSCYKVKSFNNGVGCNNNNFGDPLPGVTKACYINNPATNCPQSGGVILYWNAGYNCSNSEGDAGYRLRSGTGWQNVNDGYFNDKASSVKIPSGWSVMLYSDADRNGAKVCYNASISDFGQQGNFPNSSTPINDQVSSMEVFSDTVCGGATVPSTPSNLHVSGTTQTSITIAWDDVSNETGYKIYEWNGSTFVYLASTSVNQTSYTDTRFSCGRDQFYQVSAFNNAGESAQTGWVQGYTQACTAPPAPALNNPYDQIIMNRTDNVALSWYTASTATQYYVEFWGGPSINLNSGWITNTSWSLGSQWAGTYQWRVKARNSSNLEGTWSETRMIYIKPGTPSNLSASAVSTSQINLTWSTSSDGPGNINGYRIYRDGTYISTVNNSTTNYSDTYLTCGTTYSYVVKAYQGDNISDPSNTASATPSNCPPAMPTNLVISGATTNSLTLSWQDNSNDELGFKIYRWGYDGTQWTFLYLDSVGANVTTYTQTSLNCGSNFNFYEVSAYNGNGESIHQGWIQGTTDACPVSDLTGNNISISPSTPFSNDDIHLYYDIQNISDNPSLSFRFDVYIDDQPTGCSDWGFQYGRQNELAGNTSANWNTTIPAGSLSVGAHQFRIFVDSGCEVTESNENNNIIGPISFTVLAPPSSPPTNDEIGSSKIVSSIPYMDTVDVRGATRAADDPAASNCSSTPGLASVWYKYTPPADRTVYLDTFGSDYDTVLAVWSGSPGNLTFVECNDDFDNAGGNYQSAVQLNLTGGMTYYFEITQWSWGVAAASGLSGAETGGRTPSSAGTVSTGTIEKYVPEVSAQSGGNLAFHVTTFADAPGNAWYWKYVEGFYAQGITTGCALGPFRYCPERAVTRAEMAVFILRAQNGASYIPGPAETGMFADVPVVGKEWMQPWIEQFYASGMTTGCAASPLRYCPEREVTRAEMAVFVLRAVHGASYVPPAASGVFSDLPVAGKEWMQPWIEQFYVEGITTGCASAPLRYCPEQSVTRAEMATFIDRAFAIPTLPLP